MDIINRIESIIDINKSIDQQHNSLAHFDNITEDEIKFISERGHKSAHVGKLLEYLGYQKLINHLPAFLVFLQDVNWPAALGAAKMLAKAKELILPEISRVFIEVNDDLWKYEILRFIVDDWDKELVRNLQKELIHLIEHESWSMDGTGIQALLLLQKHDLISKEQSKHLYSHLESRYSVDKLNNWNQELTELRKACS